MLAVGLGSTARAAAQSVPTLPADQGRLECLYRLTYQPDSTNPNTRSEVMSLLIGASNSRFRSRQALAQDSLLTTTEGQPFNAASAQLFADKLSKLPFSRFTYTIYKNPAAKQVLFYSKMGNKLYAYPEPENAMPWQITPLTATVAGYACQQATTVFAGRIWEAWFTREVPIAQGPYKFCGLPGLIVKVSDAKNAYSFELTKLTRLKIPVLIALPTQKVVSTTKKDFRRGEAEYAAGAIDRVIAMGNNLTEADKQAARERAKRRNNPLELK